MRPIWRAASRVAPAAALVVFLSGAVAIAQQGLSTYEQLSVGASAVGIATTTTTPTGRSQMSRCVIQAEQTVRWRADGTNPTSTSGTLMTRVDDPLSVTNAVARSIRFISTSAFTATVNVTCFP